MTLAEQMPAIDYLEPIQSQYSSSIKMLALAQGMASRLDNRDAIAVFLATVFDPRTATGIGLDIWARIVGLEGRGVYLTTSDIFGFYGQNLQNFNHAPFYSPATSNGVVNLPDDDLRGLIFAKALANISGSSLKDLNAVLRLYMRSNGLDEDLAYVEETGVMEIAIFFKRYVSNDTVRNVLEQFGLFNRPAGVKLDVRMVEQPLFFGFATGGDAQVGIFGEAPFYVG